MTSHVEDFVWGAFNVVQTSIFGSSSSADVHDTNEWTRQLGGGGGEGGAEQATHISFQDLYASIVSNDQMRELLCLFHETKELNQPSKSFCTDILRMHLRVWPNCSTLPQNAISRR
jgi:hypothetical protein